MSELLKGHEWSMLEQRDKDVKFYTSTAHGAAYVIDRHEDRVFVSNDWNNKQRFVIPPTNNKLDFVLEWK